MQKTIPAALAAALCIAPLTAALGDSTQARCDIYPRGSDQVEKMIPCVFSQRRGYVTIDRDDGVRHELEPTGEATGNFRDQDGRSVYRQSGLGREGLIFRFPDESVYLYWSTAALEPQAEADNDTAPFTTDDYDATTRLRCRAAGDSEFGSCPAGVLRMDGGEASVVIQNQLGQTFTINFMRDYVNATSGEVEARMEGDTWIVTVAGDYGEEVYEVPLAAIEGG